MPLLPNHRLLPFLAAAFALACGSLVIEGPQLADPPEGLGYTTSFASARKPLPNRPPVRQLAYTAPGDAADFVAITECDGAATDDEIRAARDFWAGQYKSEEYSPPEPVTIAGHAGWGWMVTSRYRDAVWSRAWTVVLPWGRRPTRSSTSPTPPRPGSRRT